MVKKKSTTKSFGKKKNAKGAKNGDKGTRKGSNLAEEGEGIKPGVEPASPSAPATSVGTSAGVAELEEAGLQPAGGGAVNGARGRRDTGVATLLVALATADPSGDAIRSMQRWACEALLPEEVRGARAALLAPVSESPPRGQCAVALISNPSFPTVPRKKRILHKFQMVCKKGEVQH